MTGVDGFISRTAHRPRFEEAALHGHAYINHIWMDRIFTFCHDAISLSRVDYGAFGLRMTESVSARNRDQPNLLLNVCTSLRITE